MPAKLPTFGQQLGLCKDFTSKHFLLHDAGVCRRILCGCLLATYRPSASSGAICRSLSTSSEGCSHRCNPLHTTATCPSPSKLVGKNTSDETLISKGLANYSSKVSQQTCLDRVEDKPILKLSMCKPHEPKQNNRSLCAPTQMWAGAVHCELCTFTFHQAKPVFLSVA